MLAPVVYRLINVINVWLYDNQSHSYNITNNLIEYNYFDSFHRHCMRPLQRYSTNAEIVSCRRYTDVAVYCYI